VARCRNCCRGCAFDVCRPQSGEARAMTWDRVPRSTYVNFIRSHFGPLLEPYGFTTKGSRSGTYWKQAAPDIYHFIAPKRSNRNNGYKVWIFVSSPAIHERWLERFPDSLPHPNPYKMYLSNEEGVGSHQQCFFAGNENAFQTCFKRDVSTGLIANAIPFLNGICSFDHLARYLPYTGMRGAALLRAGHTDEARKLLSREVSNLSQLADDKQATIKSAMDFYQNLLAEIDA
jgi:hypothetical protein